MSHPGRADLDVSVIIPARDEAPTIAPLFAEITEAMAQRPDLGFEIVFIDDGSEDDTWAQIAALAERDEPRPAVRFRRNFGKAAALAAGFATPAAA